MSGPVPQAVPEAMRMLWGYHGPRPQNALSTLEFEALQNACVAAYPINADLFLSMSLWEILRSLGYPMLLPEGQGDKALDVEVASRQLHATLTAKSAEIVHLCPLDWTDEPPPLVFGRSAMGRFSTEQLQDTILYQRALGLTHVIFSTAWNTDSISRGGFVHGCCGESSDGLLG